MKKIKAFFDNGRSKREEERAESSDYAAAIAKLPKLETLAVNLNIIDSLPLTGSKVGSAAALLFTVKRLEKAVQNVAISKNLPEVLSV
jgi:hypothetical protein